MVAPLTYGNIPVPEKITLFEILTVIALVVGPVLAVIIARNMETRHAKRERRMDIFRTLMRTRRSRLLPDHVGALNLVEIEFKDESAVIKEWKAYFEDLCTDHPKRTEEQIENEMTPEEKQQRFTKFDERIGRYREKLFAKVLHAIAKVLDFEVEQLEIFEGGYAPQAYADIDWEQATIRRFIIGLYLGKYKVPIALTDYTKPPSDERDQTKDDVRDTEKPRKK